MPAHADAAPAPAVLRRSIRARLGWTLIAFGALAGAACVLAPLAGSTPIRLRAVFNPSIPYADNIDAQIFFVARLPRVLAAALVGAALAVSGVVFQALLRNPLASPDTLGVSAGASLGAMIAITFGLDFSLLGLSAVPLATFAGAAGALAVVYGLSVARRRGTSAMVLLLGGVTLQVLLGAAIACIQFLADFTQTFRNVRWLMGSLDVASFAPIAASLVPMLAAAVGFATLPHALNLLSVGAESAAARGVAVERSERVALVSASIATGAAVSLAGPVSFIGIIVPHLVRLLVGADHRLVMPASALFGAAFLIACDLLARTIAAPLELPVGIVTAIIGGPIFLWLLFRRA
ncbi:MAG: iron ABC transporter permease [Acidobacteria bacterium]|nr:iron ABC transporter permease [Acidobacteriota bacterium]